MKTIVEKIDREQLDSGAVQTAGRILRQGGLVAFPTETVYGLGADALDEDAAKKIYAAKGRPSDNPLIVHIARMEDLPKIAARIPEAARRLADAFWPGPLTMVFEKTDAVPYGTTGGLDTVAVRMPGDEAARAVIAAGGGCIAAPSANISGRPSPTKAAHVKADMEGKADMILDGGDVPIGVESTILDMTGTPPVLLRPGAVTKEMLGAVIGEVAEDPTLARPDGALRPKAPGMKYRHYAPKAELFIVDGDPHKVIQKINALARQKRQEGGQAGILATDETASRYPEGIVKSVGPRRDEAVVASRLFAVLREFDEEKVDVIYSEAFGTDGIGRAVMNRLLKAAGYRRLQA